MRKKAIPKTDALGVSLRAGHLYLRNGMQFLSNEVTDLAAMWPIAFLNRNLTSAETHYSSIEREAKVYSMI